MHAQLLTNSLALRATSPCTAQALESFYEQLLVMHEEKVPPLIIVANKADLVEDRVISADEGKKLAASWKASYIETSAKTGQNVELAFTTLARCASCCANVSWQLTTFVHAAR